MRVFAAPGRFEHRVEEDLDAMPACGLLGQGKELYEVTWDRVAEGNEDKFRVRARRETEFLLGININDQVEVVKVSYERCIHSAVLDF